MHNVVKWPNILSFLHKIKGERVTQHERVKRLAAIIKVPQFILILGSFSNLTKILQPRWLVINRHEPFIGRIKNMIMSS